MNVPTSTYRVQLHAGFTFRDLTARLVYLRDLGVGWIYASPVLAAVPGSTHGYDVTDVTRLNPELGTAQDWTELHAHRRELGIGWLQDIVPNHMAYDLANPWVVEVLKHGQASTVAKHFDIDWQHPGYRGRVMLPILGARLAEALANGDVSVDRGAKVVRVYERELPMSARSLAKLDAGASATDEDLLSAQHYALVFWKVTHAEINYRRFFTVNGLICLRVERPDTFTATHALVREWLGAGEVDGLRLDHIDGLLDPTGYLRRLRDAVGEGTYILAEKILEPSERLPESWPIQGTTGYDFLSHANQLLRDPVASARAISTYRTFVGDDELRPIGEDVYDNKLLILRTRMAGELDNLLHHARGALAGLPLGMDVEGLRAAVSHWLAAFPVYRGYPRRGRFDDDARRILVGAADRAIAMRPTHAEPVGQLRAWLRSITSLDEKSATFLQRAMQLSGPLMAKGIEDTTFYQRFEYLACNEVGDSPDPSHVLSISEFHDRMAERRLTDLNCTSTHDTKRAEDTRARLHALAQHSQRWEGYLREPEIVETYEGTQLPREVCYFALQTYVSSWPDPMGGALDRDDLAKYLQRVRATVVKAMRESKTFSSWSDPDATAEANAESFVCGALASDGVASATAQLVRDIAASAHLNSLRQVVLKFTAPGVPDTYQGCEFPDYSMVDPDNRRPVDYEARAAAIEAFGTDDRAHPPTVQKLAVTAALMRMRRDFPDLFRYGQYVPLNIDGEGRTDEVVAFRRVHGDDSCLVIVSVRTDASVDSPVGAYFEGATAKISPVSAYYDVFGGNTRELRAEESLANLLSDRPYCVLLNGPSVGAAV